MCQHSVCTLMYHIHAARWNLCHYNWSADGFKDKSSHMQILRLQTAFSIYGTSCFSFILFFRWTALQWRFQIISQSLSLYAVLCLLAVKPEAARPPRKSPLSTLMSLFAAIAFEQCSLSGWRGSPDQSSLYVRSTAVSCSFLQPQKNHNIWITEKKMFNYILQLSECPSINLWLE